MSGFGNVGLSAMGRKRNKKEAVEENEGTDESGGEMTGEDPAENFYRKAWKAAKEDGSCPAALEFE